MAGGLHGEVLSLRSELDDLIPDWRRLVRRAPSTSAFQHPGWVTAWLDAQEDEPTLAVVVIRDATDIVGVLPLMIHPRQVLRFIGHPLNDRNGAVAAEVDRHVVWSTGLDVLARSLPRAEIEFPELSDTDRVACLASRPTLRGTAREPSPAITLPHSRQDYDAKLHHRRRAGWRRARRRLQEIAPVRFEWASGPELAPEDLRDFHRARLRRFALAGRLGELSPTERSTDFADFLAVLAHRFAPDRALGLGRLWVGERPAAQNLYLRWADVVLDYMQTFDPDLGAHSPGMLSLVEGVHHCIDEQVSVFDLGRGDEAYKFVLGACDRSLGGVVGPLN